MSISISQLLPEASYPSLRDRVVFVTGGGSGIGASIVAAFAAQGARVAFVDVAEGPSRALADEIAAAGLPAPWWRVCDVRDVAALQGAIEAAAGALGDFHALVNNVASDDRHSLEQVSVDYWEERMAVNQRPAFFAIQAAVPGMRRRGGGAIVNIGSTGWQRREGAYPLYAIAKSSVDGLTRGLAAPLGREGIRVNTVTPGWVMTERQRTQWLNPESERELERNQLLADKLLPRDVAAMVLFLVSDDSRMCTAQEYKVDAGWT